MNLSRFVLLYDDVREGEHVLYSVLNDRYLGLDAEALEAIRRWCAGGDAASDDEREAQQMLLDEGFLVADQSVDDERLARELHRAKGGLPSTLHVTLMPTLACNIACNYCFQKESPAFDSMHRATEDATLEWLLRTVDERALSTLHVHYFGGEPLTRKAFCLRTAEVLSESMRARGGTFRWNMTTNGIGLDVPFALAMRAFGEGSFKITLDGDRESHDQMRVRRDGSGTFDEIFANVLAVAPHLPVFIGGNFLPHQAASFERLLERIDQSGLGPKLAGVKFKPIVETQRTAKSSCTGCGDKSETETLVQLNRSIRKRKLGVGEERGTLESMLGPCELHWSNSYTIDPSGHIYKCPAVAGRSEMAVAHVAERGPEAVAPLLKLRPWEQCGDCPFLSVCVGGCLGGQFLKTGRTDQVLCRREQFERSFREVVTQRYLAEFSSASGWDSESKATPTAGACHEDQEEHPPVDAPEPSLHVHRLLEETPRWGA